jgi:hypothetical protein
VRVTLPPRAAGSPPLVGEAMVETAHVGYGATDPVLVSSP